MHDVGRLGAERVAEHVASPVGEYPASPGRPAEPQRFMKMSHGHCTALKTSAPDRVLCTVYDARPTLCRAFEPGSESCEEARARQALFRQTRPGSGPAT